MQYKTFQIVVCHTEISLQFMVNPVRVSTYLLGNKYGYIYSKFCVEMSPSEQIMSQE